MARSTAVGTAAAIIAAAIASATAAAEGALETLARIAADARGVARKFFARSGCAADAARGAGFSGQQDDVVFGDGRDGGGGDQRIGGNISGDGAFGHFLAVGAFVMLGARRGLRCMFRFVNAESGMMLGAFVSGVGFGFGAIGGAAFFHFGVLFVGKLGNFAWKIRIRRRGLRFGFFLVFFVFFFDDF